MIQRRMPHQAWRQAAAASGHHLVIQVLRVFCLGKKEPALSDQAGRLQQRRQQDGQRRL